MNNNFSIQQFEILLELHKSSFMNFDSLENLHKAIPNHSGDWYFTGNFPTPGGMKVANKSYLNYMDGKLVRAY